MYREVVANVFGWSALRVGIVTFTCVVGSLAGVSSEDSELDSIA